MKAFIQRSARDDIFGRDEFDAVLPAPHLAGDRRGELGIGGEAGGEKDSRHQHLASTKRLLLSADTEWMLRNEVVRFS
ncbi:MAG: hypothetical protein FD139_1535 [Methylocystaceae bacterium]|nr:MAG: hypothetical protein FD148_2050 [Methylocystaceae bacterium]KAF0213830.1 MAG: hypothetical protein FD172_257 [Methylocystaceae bacterium]TXT45596.1 MAG: hypothetical protein FD139_1535 [Methylocystaceae bacterium]